MTSTYSARERLGTTLGATQNNGGPGQIRTADLRFRKPSLYPSELQGQKHFSLFPTVLGVLRLRSGFRQRARTPAIRLNLGNRRSIHLSYRATYTHYIWPRDAPFLDLDCSDSCRRFSAS